MRFLELSKKPYYRGDLYKLEFDPKDTISGFSHSDIMDAMERSKNKRISIPKDEFLKKVIMAPIDDHLFFKDSEGNDKPIWFSSDPLTRIHWAYDKETGMTHLYISD